MEGSKLFRELESNAARFFVSNNMRSKDQQLDNLSAGSIVVKLLSNIDADYESFKKKEKQLSPPDGEFFSPSFNGGKMIIGGLEFK